MEGKLDEAEQLIEFLTEVQSSIGKNTVSKMIRVPKFLYAQYNFIFG